jgi:hypothetical protein
MNHAFILNAIQMDADFYPELECHSLTQDEFVKHRKAEDESDFAFVARYHEQYLTEKPDAEEIVEKITDYAVDKLWHHYFWDRAIPLLELTSQSDQKICDDSMAYAERRIKELGVH